MAEVSIPRGGALDTEVPTGVGLGCLVSAIEGNASGVLSFANLAGELVSIDNGAGMIARGAEQTTTSLDMGACLGRDVMALIGSTSGAYTSLALSMQDLFTTVSQDFSTAILFRLIYLKLSIKNISTQTTQLVSDNCRRKQYHGSHRWTALD